MRQAFRMGGHPANRLTWEASLGGVCVCGGVSERGLRAGKAFQGAEWEMALDTRLRKMNFLFQAIGTNWKVSEWGIMVTQTYRVT